MRGEQVQEVKGVRVLTARTDAASAESLRDAADHLRDKLQSGVVVLGTVIDGKPSLVAMATADAVGRGANAGQLVKQVAAVVGGGGGGRPELGQAGGRDATKLDDALATVPEFLARQLNGA
jgi:alanyl-tRNA synthetase